MKTRLLASMLISAMFAIPAGAEPIRIDVPRDVRPPQSTLTRAEVIVDFHMWRLAGLEELNRQGEGVADTNSYEYRRAFATYLQLRASPQFAKLVQELQQRPNASVVARTQPTLLAATKQ